jgi:hypothetical protein
VDALVILGDQSGGNTSTVVKAIVPIRTHRNRIEKPEGPAQRSLTLWPARSRSRPATLSIESSDSFVASAAASIVIGWNEPVPGHELHPLKSSAFHGALFRQSPFRDTATLGVFIDLH